MCDAEVWNDVGIYDVEFRGVIDSRDGEIDQTDFFFWTLTSESSECNSPDPLNQSCFALNRFGVVQKSLSVDRNFAGPLTKPGRWPAEQPNTI